MVLNRPMVDIIITVLAVIHFSCIACLILYGCHRIWLLLCWYEASCNPDHGIKDIRLPEKLPRVTIQLPLYNERFVAARIIDAAAKISWQKNLLEIQVLDDSSDETSEIVDERVSFWRGKGIDIKVLKRQKRQGFKAGALADGLKSATGDFIAVFDADFVPAEDFLEKTIPYFNTPDTGMVQVRWGFLNTGYSWLTRVQTLLIGHHFDIEHRIRFRKKLFFNFNGTAGVWRKKTIIDAGGWQSDTVTEDLDLSYRAQLNGWKFIYLHDYTVPSELPVTMSAFRSQQQRWATGSVQTAIKILPRLLTARIPLSVKREALFHLLANFCWVIGCISILTLFPAIIWRIGIGPLQIICIDLPLFMASAGAILLYFYLYAASISSKKARLSLSFFLIPLLCIGLAPGISFKVFQGGFKKGGIFRRTPKFGVSENKAGSEKSGVYKLNFLPDFFLNLPVFLYTLIPLVFAGQRETWFAIPFLFLFPLGYLLVMISDAGELLKS